MKKGTGPTDENVGVNVRSSEELQQKKMKARRVNTSSPIMRRANGQKHESTFTEKLALESAAQKQVWARPEVDIIDPQEHDVPFQWIDIDMCAGEPLTQHPVSGRAVPGSRRGPVPVIRIFGVTEKGNSVLLHVHGVTPYFYCDSPSQDFTIDDCGAFRQALNSAVKQQVRNNDVSGDCVVAVVPMQKQSILGYHGGKYQTFLQISVAMPNLVTTARSILRRSFSAPGFPMKQYMTYESNVPFILRYMVDNDIVGANWCELKHGTYTMRSPANKVSTCQVEFDVVFEDLQSHPTNIPRWLRIAPLRILSFDIECMGRRGVFPDPKVDPVIQIANFVTRQGETKAFVRNVFVLGNCLPIVGAEVFTFHSERELLLAWSKFIREVDPDILTGYNIQNFDMKYLLDRADALKVREFAYLGKIKNSLSKMKSTTFSSSAYGTRESIETSMEGRVMMDMIHYMFRNHKLSSYSLNAVSAEFLGQQKEEVHHSIISDLQHGTDEDRRRLAVYCLKDAYLPQQLMDKLMVVINYVEMARVTGVPIPFLFSRGQQIKVLSMLYRKAKQHRLIIPVIPRNNNGQSEGGVGYEGATVIEPKKGYYDEPIATLDFASLYPSIMMAHNLCYTTLLSKEDIDSSKVKAEQYERTPSGHCFVRSETQRGLLPIILTELLSARKTAKNDMKNATDPFEKAVMNGRQLALKVSANSVYGFTGATNGALPCLPISASVTAFGREMIDNTKTAVEKKYTVANGYPSDADVIYGDTDSVMVKFGVKNVQDAMKLGLEAANEVTKIFPKPIALEFEKVYYPYLLMNKKRYAGLHWSNPEKWDKMDCKGIETVRRDNCGLVRIVIGTCLRKILMERSVQSAIDYVKETISSLLMNKVDISLLIITKSLSGKSEDYAAKQPHVELAKRMRERDAGSAPVVGDRVPYVIVQAAKGAQAFTRSEDPIYVLENNIPIDFNYYLENQLSKPLIRLFGPIISNPEAVLLRGEHTRSVYKATPSSNIGIMRFAVKTLKCLGCKVPLPKGQKGSLCKHCEERRSELYLNKVDEANSLEARFSKLWTQCQRCQGSLHQDVLCTSKDCPIFYMRKKVQKDLKDNQETLKRFEEW